MLRMMKWIDKLPLTALIIVALTLGLAPFSPQPHIVEKLGMLFDGSLTRPIDIFDLLLHGTPWILLALKLARMALFRSN
jgi:hypothetical protein